MAVIDTDVIGIDNVVGSVMIRTLLIWLFGPFPPLPSFLPPEPLTLFPPPTYGEAEGWDSEAGVSDRLLLLAKAEGSSFEIFLLLPTTPPPERVSCQRSLERCQVCQNTLRAGFQT